MATSRSIIGSCALRTTPIPPCPSTPVTWYFPRDLPTQAWTVPPPVGGLGPSTEASGRQAAVSEGSNSCAESTGFAGVEAGCLLCRGPSSAVASTRSGVAKPSVYVP